MSSSLFPGARYLSLKLKTALPVYAETKSLVLKSVRHLAILRLNGATSCDRSRPPGLSGNAILSVSNRVHTRPQTLTPLTRLPLCDKSSLDAGAQPRIDLGVADASLSAGRSGSI